MERDGRVVERYNNGQQTSRVRYMQRGGGAVHSETRTHDQCTAKQRHMQRGGGAMHSETRTHDKCTAKQHRSKAVTDHFNIMPSLIRKPKMDIIVVEAVQPEPEAAVIDEEVQPEAVIEVEDEEGQPEITEGQLEMQPDVENEETQPQPLSDHYVYVMGSFCRNTYVWGMGR
ncbi:hypothetical protein DEO72_LG1g611 [Vigna unguiculata]|uniref:Uncharacterized protein n=1 Tax=Vigna unguiculata TaxID=3917 RepID=A0A4D6KPG4_VIGUN|nr:hypothetical protein DEO72_LG1g611 [Vigna unguiculata]